MDIIDEYNMLKKNLSCISLDNSDKNNINKKCGSFNIYLNIVMISVMILFNYFVSEWAIMMNNILISKIFTFILGNFGVIYLTLFFRDIIKNDYKKFMENKILNNKKDGIENRLNELSSEIKKVYNIKLSNDKDFVIAKPLFESKINGEIKDRDIMISGYRTLDNNHVYKSNKPLARIRKK